MKTIEKELSAQEAKKLIIKLIPGIDSKNPVKATNGVLEENFDEALSVLNGKHLVQKRICAQNKEDYRASLVDCVLLSYLIKYNQRLSNYIKS